LAQALRSYLAGVPPADLGRLAALRDPAVAMAVELLREHPERPWTVGALAREIGLSRTLFASRFRALVGETPIRYLTKVRLRQAAGHLATTDEKMYAIARRAGYDSEASFSKAFKRAFGSAPGAYRRGSLAKPIRFETEPRGRETPRLAR
jgi:transcriptional regulator GlxA family with amidase domain